MQRVILINIISLIGEICNTILPFLDTKKKMMLLQVLAQIVFIVAYNLSGGYVMITLCIIVMVRNLYSAFKEPNSIMYVILLIGGTAICFVTNTNGYIGILPIICYITYTIGIWKTNNEQVLRKILVFNLMLYVIFNIYLKIYVSAIFNIVNIFTTMIAIYKYSNKEVVSVKNIYKHE